MTSLETKFQLAAPRGKHRTEIHKELDGLTEGKPELKPDIHIKSSSTGFPPTPRLETLRLAMLQKRQLATEETLAVEQNASQAISEVRAGGFRSTRVTLGAVALTALIVAGGGGAAALGGNNGQQFSILMDVPGTVHSVTVSGLNNFTDGYGTHGLNYAGGQTWTLKDHWWKHTVTVVATYTDSSGRIRTIGRYAHVPKFDLLSDWTTVKWSEIACTVGCR